MNLSTQSTGIKVEAAGPRERQSMPSGFRPWDDTTLSPEQRFEAYKAHVQQQVESLIAAAGKLGPREFEQFEKAPATKELLAHAEELANMTVEEYSQRVVAHSDMRTLLGGSFLGADEWKAAFGVDVGAVPLIPSSITKELLESPCPFSALGLIKDTHLLVLVPKNIDGVPYSLLNLRELCITKDPAGYPLIHESPIASGNTWKGMPFASKTPDSSSWVLMLKDEPTEWFVRNREAMLHCKSLKGQVKALDVYHPQYKEVQALERVTALVLYEAVHGERLQSSKTRCQEPNSSGEGRIIVRQNFDHGVEIEDDDRGVPSGYTCLGVSRKL